MKNKVATILAGLLMALTTSSSFAMSELISLSALPVWPNSTTPNTTVMYNVSTVGRGGAGMLEVELTAGGLPPGITVTFTPSVLRFTGNQLTTQIATMTVLCTIPTPVDCYPFTITGTSRRESITITNVVMFTPEFVANRPATLYIDNQGNGSLLIRGLGATARNYQIEATSDLVNPDWQPLGNTTADGNGRFIFPISQTIEARFFRAREVVTP
jgi:hypothetical protein